MHGVDTNFRAIKRQKLIGIRKYLKPIFVALLIFMFACILCLLTIRRESIKNTEKTADYFIQNIENQLVNITSYSYHTINDEKAKEISRMLKAGEEDQQEFLSQCIKLATYAREFCVANPIVQDVVYYFPNHDLVIDRQGVFNTKKFSVLSNIGTQLTEENITEYSDSLFEHGRNCFFTVDNSNGSSEEFFFFRSFPDNVPIENAERVVLFKFDKSRIAEIMGDLAELMNQNYICMMTNDGKIFVESGKPSNWDKTSGIYDYIEDNKSLITNSKLWNMDVYIEPNLTEVERYMRTITLILIIGVLVAGALGMVFVVRDYEKVLKKVVPVLDKTGGMTQNDAAKGKDINEIMADRLSDYYKSDSEKSDTIDKQKSQIQALKKEYSALEKMIKEANNSPEGEKAIENDKIFENVADYACKLIEQGYSDSNMGLAMIADVIGVSQAYLSRAFKKEKGENISVYLSTVRIEHAKELLCRSSDNIGMIAEKTGFASDVTFIRVFKKIVGDTPNNYRKNAQDNYQNLT